jgi:hypothetical protein
MPDKTPGYRLFFKDNTGYTKLISILVPVAQSVAEDDRVYQYTKGLAGEIYHMEQRERAARLLDFISQRSHIPEFVSLMRAVLQDHTELNGFLVEEQESHGEQVWSLRAAQRQSLKITEVPLVTSAAPPILGGPASSSANQWHHKTTLSPVSSASSVAPFTPVEPASSSSKSTPSPAPAHLSHLSVLPPLESTVSGKLPNPLHNNGILLFFFE